jgi:hypothetical protein
MVVVVLVVLCVRWSRTVDYATVEYFQSDYEIRDPYRRVEYAEAVRYADQDAVIHQRQEEAKQRELDLQDEVDYLYSKPDKIATTSTVIPKAQMTTPRKYVAENKHHELHTASTFQKSTNKTSRYAVPPTLRRV